VVVAFLGMRAMLPLDIRQIHYPPRFPRLAPRLPPSMAPRGTRQLAPPDHAGPVTRGFSGANLATTARSSNHAGPSVRWGFST
jgi:hypothetical protein